MSRNADADWTGYYAWSSGRQPRPMLLAACEQLGDGAGRMAVDLGCGDGTDVLALLERGWSVLAVEIEQAGLAILKARIPGACADRIRLACGSFTDIALPSAHLIHAGFSLPFCSPSQFSGVWEQIRRALVPSGIFAGQLFGTHDSWADNPGMTFQDRSTVTSLLDGLDIIQLHETERDGEAYSGPKHWHTYDILVRKPVQHAHLDSVFLTQTSACKPALCREFRDRQQSARLAHSGYRAFAVGPDWPDAGWPFRACWRGGRPFIAVR